MHPRTPRPWTPRPAALATVVWLGLLACTLASDARAATVRYSAPDGCPDASELAYRVRRDLPSSTWERAPLHFQVDVRRVPDGYESEVLVTESTRSADASQPRRTLRRSDCSELLDAAAVAIVLAVAQRERDDAGAVAAPPGSSEPAASEPSPEGSRPELDAPRRATPPGPDGSREVRTLATVLALGDLGALPSPAAGLALSVELEGERWGVGVAGRVFGEQTVEVVEASTFRPPDADLNLWALGLHACLRLPGSSPTSSLAWRACAGPEAGQLAGRGRGLQRERSGWIPWIAALAELQAHVSLPGAPFRAVASLGATAPLYRGDFVIGDAATVVHRPGNVTGRAALGVALDLF